MLNIFWYCISLTSINIPNNVSNIGESAFSNCIKLTSINIPNSVMTIGKSAFDSCLSLTSIDVATDNYYSTSIDGVLFNKDKTTILCFPAGKVLSTYNIPNSVTTIEDHAFFFCSGLSSVTIPNSVTTIGYYAFYQCSALTSITIPNSVTSIGGGAFDYTGLTSIYSLIENPFEIHGKTSGYNTFGDDIFNNATLYVPNGTVSKYRSTGGWRDFANIEEMSDDELTLTIQDAQEGKVKLLVKAGDIFTFQIEPESGWTIHSVTYNEEDITSELDSENKFTTPAILESAVLNISYEQTIPTDAKWSNTENLKVRCNSSRVVVSGIGEGLPILVYNTDGQLVGSASSTLGATLVETTLNSGDVAIVKVGDKAVKLVME